MPKHERIEDSEDDDVEFIDDGAVEEDDDSDFEVKPRSRKSSAAKKPAKPRAPRAPAAPKPKAAAAPKAASADGEPSAKKPRRAPAPKASGASIAAPDTGGSMERNLRIAELLDRLASVIGSNSEDKNAFYKQRSMVSAASAIRGADFPIQTGAQAAKALKGVGESTAMKIDEIIKTGTLAALEASGADPKMKAILDFQRLPGIGDKRARKLYEEDGVTSLDDLRMRTDLLEPGQAAALRHLESLDKPVHKDRALQIVERIRAVAHGMDATTRLELCGDFRRGAAESTDIVLVLTRAGAKNVDQGGDKAAHLDSESVSFLASLVSALQQERVIVDVLASHDADCLAAVTIPSAEAPATAEPAAPPAPAEPASTVDAFADVDIPDVDDVDAQQAALARAPKTVSARPAAAVAVASGGAPESTAANVHRASIYMVGENAWISSLVLHTGPQNFVMALRTNGKKNGFKVSDYGIRALITETEDADALVVAAAARGTNKMFAAKPKSAAADEDDGEKKVTKELFGPVIEFKTEQELFERIGVPYVAPADRR